MLKYGVFGANGKMGQAVIKNSQYFKAELVKEFVSSKDKATSGRACVLSPQEAKGLDFIVDFSTPSASLELARLLQGSEVFIICGTTGFLESEMEDLKKMSSGVKILYSANFSMAVNKVFEVIKNLAGAFKDYEVEILEKHHSLKKDAPSGTALTMGKIVADARGENFEKVKSIKRDGLRKQSDIGFACIRQGMLNGFHEVSFANKDERIFIGHEAFNKDIFAKGAIEAGIKACEKIKKPNGFFEISDILF